MKFAILSIPHTGSHFVNHLLGGGDRIEMLGLNTTGDHQLYVSHTYNLKVFRGVKEQGYEIVVPMRHPIATLNSWATWADKSPIEHKGHMVRPAYVPTLFKQLIAASKKFKLNFLPVDSPYREEFLELFNKKYHLSLTTKWKPLNSIGQDRLEATPDIRKEMEELIEGNPDFFNQFYKEL